MKIAEIWDVTWRYLAIALVMGLMFWGGIRWSESCPRVRSINRFEGLRSFYGGKGWVRPQSKCDDVNKKEKKEGDQDAPSRN
jgi:hypothetical protein